MSWVPIVTYVFVFLYLVAVMLGGGDGPDHA